MKWGKTKVTINNYLEVFSDYSKDIKEVVRSAILDDTPIEPYIAMYKNNPYMLWQIKMSMDEGLDTYWFEATNSGSIISELRVLYRRGINIEPLKKYFSKGLSENHYKYIIKWHKEGYALNKYNFEILQDDLLEVYDFGITKGYPMDKFNNGVHYSSEYIMCCLKILSNKKSINKFLKGDWNIENLELLSKYSKSRYYDGVIDYVSKEITPSVLEELYECSKVGMPLDEVSSLDEEGFYIYSGVHIAIIREAYINKWDYSSLLDTSLSINELNIKLDELRYNSKKRISGRLRKN